MGQADNERRSRIPGTGSYDTVKRNGYTYLRARVWCDDAKGIHRRVEVYAKTQAEISKKVKALKTSPVQRDTKKLLLGDFLKDRFLPSMKQAVKYSTYSAYRTAATQYIVPEIGKVPVYDVGNTPM